MRTLEDMTVRLTDDLMSAASSSLFTPTRLLQALQDAHIWATSLYSWPELEVGRDTSSVANQEYYDYPEEFRTDTLSEFIYFDGKAYRKKAWTDYLEHQRLNPNSTRRIFADYGRKYFIFPKPTSVATISIWGQIQAPQITLPADQTIFSYHDESGNEAIEKKALSVLVKRINPNLAQAEEKNAVTLLSIIWDKIQKRQASAQTLDKPMFRIPDFYSGSGFITANFGNVGGED